MFVVVVGQDALSGEFGDGRFVLSCVIGGVGHAKDGQEFSALRPWIWE